MAWNVLAVKLNFHFLLLGKFLAETARRRRES
jgi:hypothetical protein